MNQPPLDQVEAFEHIERFAGSMTDWEIFRRQRFINEARSVFMQGGRSDNGGDIQLGEALLTSLFLLNREVLSFLQGEISDADHVWQALQGDIQTVAGFIADHFWQNGRHSLSALVGRAINNIASARHAYQTIFLTFASEFFDSSRYAEASA